MRSTSGSAPSKRAQTIRIGPGETRFQDWCLECLDTTGLASVSVKWALVEGELPLGASAGLALCPRGHRLAVHRDSRLDSAA